MESQPQSSAAVVTSASQESNEVGIDFGRILGAIRKFFWVIVLVLVVGIIAAVVFLNVATPVYRSVALVKVEQRVMDAAPLTNAAMSEDLRSLDMMGTIQRGFLTRSLMERVTDKLKLVEKPSFFPAGTPAVDRNEGACITYLTEHIKTDVVRGTRFIQIKFDHPDAEIAHDVTEALVTEYIALDGEQRFNGAVASIDYLDKEVKRLENNLEESKRKLNTYAQELESVSVSDEMNIVAKTLEELNSRLTVAIADRLKLEADFEQIQKVRDDPDALLGIGSINQLPEIQQIRAALNDLDAEISATAQTFGPLNPKTKELQSRRQTLQENLKAEALRAPSTVEITLRAAVQNENSLERQTKLQEKKTLDLKQVAVESSVLEGKIEADKATYLTALQRLNEELSQARSQPIFLQLVDPASPGFLIFPKPVIVVLIAIVGSIAVAAGIIFLIAVLDTSFKSVDEIESNLGIPVMAAIPKTLPSTSKKQGDESAHTAISVLEDAHSTVSEAFRTLRAALHLADDENSLLLLTSAVPGEGKSYCAINLATVVAQQEMKTLLIDADLRKPVIERRLFNTSTKYGFSDFLAGQAEIQDIIVPSEVGKFDVIPAGRYSTNPSELLSRKSRVAALLAAATSKYDRVIVDSAPILAVSDTLSLARHFRSITIVVRSHKTPSRFVKRAVDLVGRTGHPVTGVALNQVPARGAGYQYYYHVGVEAENLLEAKPKSA